MSEDAQRVAVQDRNAFRVASVRPFWRYAVCMAERPDMPAVPFRDLGSALAFFDESRAQFPERTTVMLKRRPWRPWRRREVEVYRP